MQRVGERALYTMAEKRLLPIYSVGREDKKISISFDCAWGVEYTDEILNIMDEYGVKCTFFAVEFWVERYPEYAKKIVERGHELGTHSKTHPKMSELTEEKMREELLSSSKKIEEITGVKPQLFRPPFGDYNNLLIEVSYSLSLYPIQWDVDSLDWKNLSKEEIYARIEKRTKSGSIILCHNNGLHTAKALPLIFSALQNKGYTFVPIGELIYRDNYTVDTQGKQQPNG
jgi:polysaccharide deacetylase family sporulation protein PdaB